MAQGKKELILTFLFSNTSIKVIYEVYEIEKTFYCCLVNWTQILQCTTKVWGAKHYLVLSHVRLTEDD